MYNIGDRITHKIFGKGTIVNIEERPIYYNGKQRGFDSPIITVEFDELIKAENEKDLYFLRDKDLKFRSFTETTLPLFALIDEK